jgi:hypothetical protein
MQLVDQRMYPQRPAAGAPPTARAATCCSGPPGTHPELAERHPAVARLVEAVTDRLDRSAGERLQARQAAELQTSASSAAPRDPGQARPLDAQEWAFLRRHP